MKTSMALAALTLVASLATSDPTRLPERLSDSGLYAAGAPDVVDPRNRPFVPQYPLWSDGLKKRRWVYLPPGTTIDASDPHGWRFPVGTKFWKEFSLGDRRVETRTIWKVSETRWLFGSYAWNAEGTSALLVPDGATAAAEVAPGRRHSIPSQVECAACHSGGGPIGFTALQLSADRDPGAIHAEPLPPAALTVQTLLAEGTLAPAHGDIAAPVRIRTSDPLTRAVLGYMVGNCSMCHNGKGEIAAAAPVITERALIEDGDAVARSLMAHPTRWQQPGVPDGKSVLVTPGAPELSALFARMRSRAPSSQMPPLGTVLRDDRALEMVKDWILALSKAH